MNNKEVNFYNNNEIKEENQEKNKNDLCSLILVILLDCIFEKNQKKNFNQICNLIKNMELNEFLFISILNELLHIFSRNMDFNNMYAIKYINIDNNNKEKTKDSRSKSVIEEDNFDLMNFYEDLFYFILILLKKKYCSEETINKNNDTLNENKANNNNYNIINYKKQDRIQLEFIHLLIFIEQMINPFTNYEMIQ